MGALWNPEQFTEGGVKSVKSFKGRLRAVEEDVEGRFGPQVQLEFYDVRDVEADDSFDVGDDGELTYYIKQSPKKGSTNGKMIKDWMDFVVAHKFGPLPNSLYDVDIAWVRAEYDFGPDNNPGKAMVPASLIEGTGTPAARKPGTTAAPAPPPADYEVPEELVNAVLAAVGEDGGTKDIIRRAISTKSALRKLATEAPGGLDTILSVLVAAGFLNQQDEFYIKPEDDLPF